MTRLPPQRVSLNERQAAYLLAAYKQDQRAEQSEAGAWHRGHQRRQADEWRWLVYGRTVWGDETPLRVEVQRQAGGVDEGTGSTWIALKRRGLLLHRACSGPFGESWCEVRLTPKGRKLARELSSEPAKVRLPPGTLREWHWQALAQAWEAGEAGLERSPGSWRTWERLVNYKAGALVKEFSVRVQRRRVDGSVQLDEEWRLRCTEEGRVFYQREWERYQQMYPDVKAPEPDSTMRQALERVELDLSDVGTEPPQEQHGSVVQ